MRISPETIYRWIYAAAQPGDAGYRICAAPTDAAGGTAGTGTADICFPGVLTYLSGHSLLPTEPAMESGGQFGPRCGRQGGAGQLQRTQKPVSGVGQGLKQEGHLVQCGSYSSLVCCAIELEADADP